MINFANKNILITGAASGIGRQTAITLSRLGAQLILLDLSQEGLDETLNLLSGNNHFSIQCDLSQIDCLSKIIQEVVEKYGRFSGFVHCAGISSRKPINVLKRDGFSKVMDVNFYSFIELTKQITKKKNFVDEGSIVVMSSISSIRGYKAKTEYCVSKAAIDAFVRCSALELADRKIRINSVMPAEVLTPLALKAKAINDSLGVQEFHSPLGATEPYEVANLIAFLLSDATKTITGTSILIDGGATI